jgi:hypothetical protein
MKRRTKRATRKQKFAVVGEHIRVVPLHQPAVAAPPQADLTYRGGALIRNVEAFTIFLGETVGTVVRFDRHHEQAQQVLR